MQSCSDVNLYPNNDPIVLDHPPSGLPMDDIPISTVYKVEAEPPFIPVTTQSGRYRGPYVPVGSLSKSETSASYYPATEVATLEKNGWIRTNPLDYSDNVQVFILPNDVQGASAQKAKPRPKAKIRALMAKIDNSSDAWAGLSDAHPTQSGYLGSNPEDEDESLWYIFNTLQSPNPSPQNMKNVSSRQAMESLLDESDYPVQGLKTALYPYQRRSAATMVQREAQPAMVLDPRLQAVEGPTGTRFYYDKVEGTLLKGKRLYSEACGGILAESMGCGKTLICLAVILATRGHFPAIPIEYQTYENPIRRRTGSLMQMAAATAGRFSVPWKMFFDSLSREGQFHDNCLKACMENSGCYNIPPDVTKNPRRNSTSPYLRDPAQEVRLCSGTIVIVPPNMVDHWENEIATHTTGLRVVTLRESSDRTPTADELMEFDLVLFSRNRFEKEVPEKKHIQPKGGKAVKLVQEESPLLSLHWLRVIVDEGHNVSSQKTRLTDMLKRLHFERRWVISGTPSPGLYGVEVSLASQEADTSGTESPEEATQAILKKRKRTGNAVDNELKALDHLREMVIHFLDLKPWSSLSPGDSANWTNYMKPIGADGKRRKAPSLRPTLQSLVVRHRKDVVDREKPLPKLYNKVTYLTPTFYDKLSINMFLFTLAVNAITSERVGPDYMFNSKNRKHLNQVIENIRQAGFWWAGSTQASDSIDLARRYLESNHDKMHPSDIKLLADGIRIATTAINSPNWQGFNSLHELGVFVQNFPEDYRSSWAVASGACDNPLLMGISQACKAQEFVTEHLRSPDPAEGLSGAGIKARGELTHHDDAPARGAPDPANTPMVQRQLAHTAKPPSNKAPKKTFEKNLFRSLPETSPLQQTRLVGTASAKLRYLLDKILEYHQSEKIIIFYEDSNTAYWTAQGLELINVEFRIYANTLKPQLRTEYLKIFRESEEVRVLLMDLGQASHGLHIAQASRVFIISPIWKPNVESQAIKRAHRIGQTKPVYVETLVLENTLEHRMLSRRKEMSEAELQLAEKGPLDDSTMSDIIQNESFLSMDYEAGSGMAQLKFPTGFFDRHKLPIPDDEEVRPRIPAKRTPQDSSNSANLESASGSGAPVAKRARVGFAADPQVIDIHDGPPDAVESVHVASSSQAPVPVRPRVGFAEDVQAREDHSASAILVGVERNREKRVSIFGP
ncbi:unnamed protein product [Penicillium salamii]|uniref:Helicase C-terminal domain-containing protein n=1 Tax=Penicillium salamii TaxID=1612424 RepID=A0A9W4JDA0_9EURO|nr:unnamed protein product [Penicillium salamii]